MKRLGGTRSRRGRDCRVSDEGCDLTRESFPAALGTIAPRLEPTRQKAGRDLEHRPAGARDRFWGLEERTNRNKWVCAPGGERTPNPCRSPISHYCSPPAFPMGAGQRRLRSASAHLARGQRRRTERVPRRVTLTTLLNHRPGAASGHPRPRRCCSVGGLPGTCWPTTEAEGRGLARPVTRANFRSIPAQPSWKTMAARRREEPP